MRSIRQVLRDRRGTSVAESVAGVAILLFTISVIGVAVTQDMGTVSVVASKSERQAMVNSLVGDKYAVTAWGSTAAPHTETMTLPNGHEARITTWLESDSTSTRFTAVTPASAGPDAADCTTSSAVARTGCVYASRVHAADLDAINPHAIIRADASGGSTAGTVDPHVATSTAIPQGTTIASGSDSVATVWRYLLAAKSTGANGEIRIIDSVTNARLAIVPIDATQQNYFGTFSVPAGHQVKVVVTSGNAVVKTVFLYRAGSTS